MRMILDQMLYAYNIPLLYAYNIHLRRDRGSPPDPLRRPSPPPPTRQLSPTNQTRHQAGFLLPGEK